MATPVTRVAQNFAGVPSSAWPVRCYVRNAVDGHLPDSGDAELCVTELFTNAITHSLSALPGGMVRVSVDVNERRVRVEVTDSGALNGDPDAAGSRLDRVDYGRGLQIVEALAASWGVTTDADTDATVAWFELETAGGG